MHTLLALVLGLLAAPGGDSWAVRDVRLDPAEDAPRFTLLLSGGRIEAVRPAADEVPAGYRNHDGAGLLAVPAFVDAYAHAGCEVPEPVAARDLETDVRADVDVGMRAANRKGIQPAFHAADVLALDDKARDTWRGQGFGALLSAPHGELLSGVGALAVTSDVAARDALLAPQAWFHGAFQARGRGYPSTLMGYHAQLRQFFHDARRFAALAGRDDVRRPWDRDLAAAQALLDGSRALMVEADTARDIRRWLRLADELGVRVAVAGGREAWKVAPELAERGVPVVLTLDWGDEPDAPEEDEGDPDEWEYREPRAVRADRRRLWEEGRDCARRLEEAGVAYAFGSGSRDAKKLLKAVRAVVEAGLDREAALRALTTGAVDAVARGGAELPAMGALEPGGVASLGLWTAHPLEDGAKLAAIFVEGERHEFDVDAEPELEGEPAEGVDVTGAWEVTYEGRGQSITIRAELDMSEDGDVTGTFTREMPDGETVSGPVEGRVAGTTLEFEGDYTINDMEIHFRFRGEVDGDALEGDTTVTAPFGEFSMDATGERVPEEVAR